MQTPLAHPPRERLHGLDAVRGIALLLGLVVHASMSWLPGAQHFWVTHDASPNALAGLLFYVPHMFRMLLFFLVAGLFAWPANAWGRSGSCAIAHAASRSRWPRSGSRC